MIAPREVIQRIKELEDLIGCTDEDGATPVEAIEEAYACLRAWREELESQELEEIFVGDRRGVDVVR